MRTRALALAATAALLGWSCGGGDGGSTEAFCDEVSSQGEIGSVQDIRDPEKARQAADFFGALAEEAPDDISEETDLLAEIFRSVAEVVGNPDSQEDPEVKERFERFQREGEETQNASQKVADFVQEECGTEDQG